MDRLQVSLLPALMVRFLLKVMVCHPLVILRVVLLDLLLLVSLVVRQLTLTSPYLVLMALNLLMVLHLVRLYLRGLPPRDACHQLVFLRVVRNLRLLVTSRLLFLKAGPLVRLLPLLLLHRPVMYLLLQRLSWRLRSRWNRSRCWVK
jgi:hypothetical protein